MPQFDKLATFLVNKDGKEEVGIADVDLPDLEYMSDKMSGAGISGEVEMPTIGHYSSMTTKLSWRVITNSSIDLSSPRAHDLEFIGAQQEYDATAGEIKVKSVKINTRLIPKKMGLGKLEVSNKTGTSNEFETLYLKVTIDDKEVLEIDKFNRISKVGGVDYMQAIRTALGQ